VAETVFYNQCLRKITLTQTNPPCSQWWLVQQAGRLIKAIDEDMQKLANEQGHKFRIPDDTSAIDPVLSHDDPDRRLWRIPMYDPDGKTLDYWEEIEYSRKAWCIDWNHQFSVFQPESGESSGESDCWGWGMAQSRY
jgi:hypothetical protein